MFITLVPWRPEGIEGENCGQNVGTVEISTDTPRCMESEKLIRKYNQLPHVDVGGKAGKLI